MRGPSKPRRRDDEICELAHRLAQDWNSNKRVMPWLRLHAQELLLLVHQDDWLWSDIALALDAANISYDTGRPWNAKILTKKISQIRSRIKPSDRQTDDLEFRNQLNVQQRSAIRRNRREQMNGRDLSQAALEDCGRVVLESVVDEGFLFGLDNGSFKGRKGRVVTIKIRVFPDTSSGE